MTDDLENKPQKNNEIKKDEKPVKADATDKLKGTTTSSNKSKELKKDISEKVLSKATLPADADKKVTTPKTKAELDKKLDGTKIDKKSKLSAKNNSSKDLKKDSPSSSQDTKKIDDSLTKNADQNELIEKLVSINRVAKVVKGGRRFSFAALVVVGDGNGMVGHGKGKAKEVPEAIKKATDEAKATMIRVPLRHGRTLHHDIKGRFDSGKVYLRSAPSGTGVIAGGPMRAVFEALGIEDIVAKSVGSSNPHNMVRATFEALKLSSSPKIIAMRRGLKINDITKRRKFNEVSDNAKN
jgi:small subunit ribosomal protein S5